MAVSYANELLLALPSLSANGRRYKATDSQTQALRNRTTSHFMQCLPVYAVEGEGLYVRQHLESSNGRDAQFYVNNGLTAITATTSYVPTDAVVAGGSAAFFALKAMLAQFDIRDQAEILASEQYDQVEFQKDAAVLALSALFDYCSANGDQSLNAQEFNSLTNIRVNQGLAQTLASTSTLDNFRQAIDTLQAEPHAVVICSSN
ncbi:MAG: hypothetical protein AB7S36_09980 [Planctomycetota bacterium]